MLSDKKAEFGRKFGDGSLFITGIHVCLGTTLARMEAQIAQGRLARFRGYASLPVTT